MLIYGGKPIKIAFLSIFQVSFEDEKKNAATIEAKPQIKNPLGDVTRFMPTTLRIKRQDAKTAAKAAANRKSSPGVQLKLRMKSINLLVLRVHIAL